jgi:hydroxymethylbilane synthase
VECPVDDDPTRAALATIDDPGTGPLVMAERAFLAELGGGCTLPVGAHAVWADDDPASDGAGRPIRLAGILASDDGRIVLRHGHEGTVPDVLGRAVARYLLEEAGGSDLGAWMPSGAGVDGFAPPVVP